jgi:hypothetical protein
LIAIVGDGKDNVNFESKQQNSKENNDNDKKTVQELHTKVQESMSLFQLLLCEVFVRKVTVAISFKFRIFEHF